MNTARGRRLGGCASAAGWSLAALVVLPLLVYLLLWGLGGFLVVADPLRQADAVVVLSGDPGERVRYAVQLYKQGYASHLVITETGERPAGETGKAGDQRGEQALRAGVDAEAILVAGGAAANTIEEALEVRELVKLQGFKRLIVVTDPYHTFRTRLIFRSELRGLGVDVAVRPLPGHWYRSTTWFLSRAGWRETVSEYAKIAGYVSGLLR